MWGAQYNFVSPILFREALIKFAPQFKGSEQHDSQEFLNFLLDGIHEDCNLITKRPVPPPESAEEEERFEKLPDWKASGIAWERYLERNSSVVVSLFQGQYRSRLTCLTCDAVSSFIYPPTYLLLTFFRRLQLLTTLLCRCHYQFLKIMELLVFPCMIVWITLFVKKF